MSSVARSRPPVSGGVAGVERVTRPTDQRTFSALGSKVRMRILDATSAEGKSILELVKEVGVRPVTLRYHLNYLRNEGLVEEVEATGPRKIGRPATLYRATRHAHVAGFPERHFDLLGQLAIEAFVDAVGQEAASVSLRRKGTAVGKAMIDEARRGAQLRRWTPDAFERLVLGGVLRNFGVSSEVLSRSPEALEYRSFTCPFLELAERMPEMVCNALDLGFHAGVDEALGGARTIRRACMGHGDSFCEYRVAWPAAVKPRSPRRRTAKRPSGGRGHD